MKITVARVCNTFESGIKNCGILKNPFVLLVIENECEFLNKYDYKTT